MALRLGARASRSLDTEIVVQARMVRLDGEAGLEATACQGCGDVLPKIRCPTSKRIDDHHCPRSEWGSRFHIRSISVITNIGGPTW